mmetsp:Transcript_9126/g.11244  ORF Transcript_9126/g.11244 Transcript_9126/m.11244 type:complete len:580 (+) Transcript_9126:121-1860(+)
MRHLLILFWGASFKFFCHGSFDTNSSLLELENTYINWKSNRGSNFEKHVFLPTRQKDGNGVSIHWSIEDDKIRLAAATRAQGWIGFGIAEAGGMPGADVFLFSLVKNGNKTSGEITDAYIGEGYVDPTEDICQDWVLLHYVAENGVIIVEAERALDTKDPQDRPFLDDSNMNMPSHRVIAAWGDNDVVFHGPKNRLQGSIRFYGPSMTDEAIFLSAMDKESEGYFDLKANGYELSTAETIYKSFCFNATDINDQKVPMDSSLHMIGIAPLINTETAKYVHHLVVFSMPSFEDGSGCNEMYGEMIYVWAPGENAFALPSAAGLPFGNNSSKAFMIQMHYNNPQGDEGIVDSSGIRVYYTSKLRKETMGLLQIGDPLVRLAGNGIGKGLTRHEFVCPSSCTEEFMSQNVTVVREMLHLHQTGVKIVNEQIRNGQVIRYSQAEYYDFDQNGLFAMQQDAFNVNSGDSFKTSCYYNGKKGEIFGYGSEDEMCITYLMYYPKTDIPLGVCGYVESGGASDYLSESCLASYDSIGIEERDLGRVFGTEKEGDCMLTVTSSGSRNMNNWRGSYLSASIVISIIFMR